MALLLTGLFVPGPFLVPFASARVEVSEPAAIILDDAAAAWRLRRSDRLSVAGAYRRADSVRTYLMNRGVPATAITLSPPSRARSVSVRFSLAP